MMTMAKPVLIVAAVAMLAPTTPATAQFGGSGGSWSPRAAESACRDALQRQQGSNQTRAVTTSDRGNGRFQVNGYLDRSRQTAPFACSVNNGNVRNVNVGKWQDKSSGGAGGAVAAVGIAVALGALIAAASSKNKSHEYDNYPDGYPDINNGDSYSPAGGITCYRQQRACFDGNNNYNAGWTSREFGY
jgi:hypothetical protein